MCRLTMDRVLPEDFFRFFHRFDIQIDNDRFLPGANENTFQRFIAAGIDLLMRHVGRHEDEIAGAGFGDEFEEIGRAHV